MNEILISKLNDTLQLLKNELDVAKRMSKRSASDVRKELSKLSPSWGEKAKVMQLKRELVQLEEEEKKATYPYTDKLIDELQEAIFQLNFIIKGAKK